MPYFHYIMCLDIVLIVVDPMMRCEVFNSNVPFYCFIIASLYTHNKYTDVVNMSILYGTTTSKHTK